MSFEPNGLAREAESFVTEIFPAGALGEFAHFSNENARSAESRPSWRVIGSRKMSAVKKYTPTVAKNPRRKSETRTKSREMPRGSVAERSRRLHH